jgi:phage FluMu gp28-like protein
LITGASQEELKALLRKTDSLSAREAQVVLSSIAGEVGKRCAQDGLFWLRFVVTRDEADPSVALKPFPVHLDYIRLIWEQLETKQKLVIAKSRQMLLSWMLAAFAVWWARHRSNQAVYWQTKAWDDAVAMVCMPSGGFQARCQFIEENLPVWMRQEYKASEGRIQYPNGSIIQALAGGADKIRGKTASVLIQDEFAFQEDQDGVYTAVAPLIQKGSKVIFVSTPNGTSNTFATLYHGRNVAQETPAS